MLVTMLARRVPVLGCALLAAAAVTAADPPIGLVVCAPGYPGDSGQAQPEMDSLAAGISDAAGWAADAVRATYYPREDAGLAALSGPDAAMTIVPLPFFLKHREELDLTPLLVVEQVGVASEVWSLVAKKGAVSSPEDLAGWTIVGVPGYAPAFVCNVALGSWGPIPAEARIEPTSRVLSFLRRAAQGEDVAVLLDTGQAAALDSLPFAENLEVVTRSAPVAGNLLCAVGHRISEERRQRFVDALTTIGSGDGGREILGTLRIETFHEPDLDALATMERAVATGGPGAR